MAEPWRDTHAAADAFAPAVRDAFLRAIAALVEAVAGSALIRAIALADPHTALASIPLETLPARLAAMPGLLRETADRAAEVALHRTLLQSGSNLRLGLRLTGGLPTEEIRRWSDTYGAAMVRDVSEETRRAIQGLVTEGIHAGRSPEATARLIERVIGLNRRQAAALTRYQAALEAGGVTGTRLERLVERYGARLLRARARLIARNETITAANRGNLETWLRNVREGVLLPDRWWVEWMAVEDDRLCPSCMALDGQRVRIGQPFVSPDYGEVVGPALHPACRCTVALVRA